MTDFLRDYLFLWREALFATRMLDRFQARIAILLLHAAVINLLFVLFALHRCTPTCR